MFLFTEIFRNLWNVQVVHNEGWFYNYNIYFFRVFGLPADFKEGVVFSTYATLVSSVQKGTFT